MNSNDKKYEHFKVVCPYTFSLWRERKQRLQQADDFKLYYQNIIQEIDNLTSRRSEKLREKVIAEPSSAKIFDYLRYEYHTIVLDAFAHQVSGENSLKQLIQLIAIDLEQKPAHLQIHQDSKEWKLNKPIPLEDAKLILPSHARSLHWNRFVSDHDDKNTAPIEHLKYYIEVAIEERIFYYFQAKSNNLGAAHKATLSHIQVEKVEDPSGGTKTHHNYQVAIRKNNKKQSSGFVLTLRLLLGCTSTTNNNLLKIHCYFIVTDNKGNKQNASDWGVNWLKITKTSAKKSIEPFAKSLANDLAYAVAPFINKYDFTDSFTLLTELLSKTTLTDNEHATLLGLLNICKNKIEGQQPTQQKALWRRVFAIELNYEQLNDVSKVLDCATCHESIRQEVYEWAAKTNLELSYYSASWLSKIADNLAIADTKSRLTLAKYTLALFDSYQAKASLVKQVLILQTTSDFAFPEVITDQLVTYLKDADSLAQAYDDIKPVVTAALNYCTNDNALQARLINAIAAPIKHFLTCKHNRATYNSDEFKNYFSRLSAFASCLSGNQFEQFDLGISDYFANHIDKYDGGLFDVCLKWLEAPIRKIDWTDPVFDKYVDSVAASLFKDYLANNLEKERYLADFSSFIQSNFSDKLTLIVKRWFTLGLEAMDKSQHTEQEVIWQRIQNGNKQLLQGSDIDNKASAETDDITVLFDEVYKCKPIELGLEEHWFDWMHKLVIDWHKTKSLNSHLIAGFISLGLAKVNSQQNTNLWFRWKSILDRCQTELS